MKKSRTHINEDNPFPFHFTFPIPGINFVGEVYEAFYAGNDKLHVELKDKYEEDGRYHPQVPRPKVDEPWDVFYEKAEFRYITYGFHTTKLHKELDVIEEEIDNKAADDIAKAKNCYGKETLNEPDMDNCTEEEREKYLLDWLALLPQQHLPHKKLCRLILKYPYLLHEEPVIEKLVSIIETAKHGLAKERHECKEALKELIPTHGGGPVNLPYGIKFAYELLGKLAVHLSKKCRNYMKDAVKFNELRTNDWDKPPYGPGSQTLYETLKEWVNENEPRLKRLSSDELKRLFFKPKDFALTKLSDSFSVSKRRIEEEIQKTAN